MSRLAVNVCTNALVFEGRYWDATGLGPTSALIEPFWIYLPQRSCNAPSAAIGRSPAREPPASESQSNRNVMCEHADSIIDSRAAASRGSITVSLGEASTLMPPSAGHAFALTYHRRTRNSIIVAPVWSRTAHGAFGGMRAVHLHDDKVASTATSFNSPAGTGMSRWMNSSSANSNQRVYV